MTLSDNPSGASYVYLLEPEIRFLEAAVEHLIPTDELGPGARDAGVVVYIDRQLAGSWGTHGRIYRGGPWMEGTPPRGDLGRGSMISEIAARWNLFQPGTPPAYARRTPQNNGNAAFTMSLISDRNAVGW